MKIQNTSGQYWSGTNWSVIQCAEEYHTVFDFPEIPGLNLEIYCDYDARYFWEEDSDNWNAEAYAANTNQ